MNGDCPQSDIVNLLPGGICSLSSLIDALLAVVVQVGSILLLLSLIWTGFLFIQAQGNSEKISSARSALMWTVVGGLLLLGAQALSLLITSTVESL